MKQNLIIIFLFVFLLLQAEDGEEFFFSQEGEGNYADELSEQMSYFRRHPLNINSASKTDLEKLPWLSEREIKLIISLQKRRSIKGIGDLENIGINSITISEIEKFISFQQSSKLNFDQRSRIEYNEKYKDVPSSLKYYHRTLLDYGKFSVGFLSEKDELEKDFLDYYSYFINYKSDALLKNLILGKYRLAIGQGILFAPKLGMSKSSAVTSTPQKKYATIKPYTSSYEIWDLEGVAAEIRIKNVSIIPYFSYTKLSANLDSTKITSFNLSGLHLVASKKDNVTEKILGSALKYHFAENQIGINFTKLEFDKQFADPDLANEYLAYNLDFRLNSLGFPLFGEVAIADKKYAFVSGVKLIDNKLRQLFLIRSYQKNFPTWHGHPFSAQSNFDNEIGIYYGFTLLPSNRVKINCYLDLWRYPQTRYFEKMPTVGSEQFIQLEKKFVSQSIRITLQNKTKEKYINLDEAKIRPFQRTTIRADWWQNFIGMRFKTRLEFVSEYLREDHVWEKGILTYQQVKVSYKNFGIITQLAAFHSSVLHYMYENSIDGIMQNSILTDDDLYYFFIFKYQISDAFEVQTKIADRWLKANSLKFSLQLLINF